jgi:predicted lipoprotein with Yx(FWY)xxD motif
MNRTKIALTGLFMAGLVISLVAFIGPAQAAPPAAMQPQPMAALRATQDAAMGGYIATDINGWTLYTYANDTPGQSNCTGGCAQAWPPYIVSQGAAPTADWAGQYSLGVIQRQDGNYQATYNDMPLYYYSQDKKPGDTRGDGVGGAWSVVNIQYSGPLYIPDQPDMGKGG